MNQLLVGKYHPDLFLKLQDGQPITLIDTTGQVAEAFADRAKISKTLYFDPSDTNFPVGLNIFDGVLDHQQFAEEITDYLFHLFPAGTNTLTRENAQFLLENTVRVLVCNPPQTFLSVLKFLTQASFRDQCLLKCKDPVVLSNWTAIHALETKAREALFFSLRTKLGKLLNDPLLRNIVSQPYNTFPASHTIIANLDRAKIGNMRAKFLGGLLIAQSRGHVVITDYGFFGLPIPLEQQRFTIGLNMLDELPTKLQQAVLNIEDKYVFPTHEKDAEILKRYVGMPNASQVMDIPEGCYLTPYNTKLQEATALPSLRRFKPLKRRTRACHTRPRLKVERDIKTYLET